MEKFEIGDYFIRLGDDGGPDLDTVCYIGQVIDAKLNPDDELTRCFGADENAKMRMRARIIADFEYVIAATYISSPTERCKKITKEEIGWYILLNENRI